MGEEQLINRLTTLANSSEVIADNIKVDKNIFKEAIELIDKLQKENKKLKKEMKVMSDKEKLEILKKLIRVALEYDVDRTYILQDMEEILNGKDYKFDLEWILENYDN